MSEEAEEHDPRTHPRLLDKISKDGRERCVEFVSALGTIVYSTPASEKRCSLATWRRWARGAEIVRRGYTDGKRALENQLSREISMIRNRLGEIGGGTKPTLANEDEIEVALIELSLALHEHHSTHTPSTSISLDSIREAILRKRMA